MSDSMPSNFSIFDYWKDKMLFDELVVWDWGEPSCWCCNKPIDTETATSLKGGNFNAIWNATSGRLQRCHIVPKSLGGPNTPDNLFLMCPKCHEKAPNSDDREAFLKWVYFKRKTNMFGIDVQELMNTTRDLCEQMDVSFDDFDNFLARRRTSDPLPVKISTHLSHVTESTVIMALLQTFQGEVAATKELASFGPLFALSLDVKSER